MKFFEKKQKYEGPAKFYCKKCGAYRGKKRQYASNIENPVMDEEGYLELKKGYCDECKPKLKFKWNSLPAFIIFAVAVVAVVTVLVLVFTGGASAKEKAEKAYAELFAKYEAYDDKTTMKSGSILLKESFIKEMEGLDDYVMYIYAEDADSTIQKITENGDTTYYLDLNGVEFGDYSNKSYIWTQDVVYEFGEEGNTKYYYESYEYAMLLTNLRKFLPENLCLNDKPKSEVWLEDGDGNEVTLFYYSDYKNALNYPQGFYEKYGDRLIHVVDGKQEPILSIPKNVDWVEHKD